MKARPPIGARVRIYARAGMPKWTGKTGVVVARHSDRIGIVVRLDPQTPLRPINPAYRAFDRVSALRFRRRDGDIVVDYHDVGAEKGSATPKATLRRRHNALKASER